MRPPLRFLLPAGIFAVLLGFLAVGLRGDPKAVPSPLIGRPVPGFTAPRLDDPARTLGRAELLGRAWVLNIWASWCAACREEHGTLAALARTGLAPVYGLDYKDTRPEALAWLARAGDPYQASLFDAEGRIGLDFGVVGVPETFVIDRQGIVRLKHTGPLTPQIVRERIEPLLKELADAR